MKRHVLPADVFPVRLPFWHTAIVYLLLEDFNAAGWVRGVVWTMMAMLWLGVLLMRRIEVVRPLDGYGERP